MRYSLLGLTCAAAFALPLRAFAQEPAPTSAPPASSGQIDLGARVTTNTGDAARYERYRDLGDGLFLESIRWNTESKNWVFDAQGAHVGRRDQRLAGELIRPGHLKLFGQWDQIPMLMSRTAQTLFTVASPGVLIVDDAIQSQVQTSVNALAGLFSANARAIDLKTRRHIALGRVEYLVNPALTLYSSLKHTGREGTIPFGGSFGHSSLVETPAPIDQTLLDVEGGAELSHKQVLVRGGYSGSFFRNDVQTLTFDSPFRLTDTTTAPSRGRLALAPSNNFVSVNGLASVRLPYRTRATASVTVGSLTSHDSTVVPHTINTALAAIPLERTDVEGDARTLGTMVSVTSRPSRLVDMSVRYRGYEYDNRTPVFTITRRVAYDNSVSVLESPKETEPFSVSRHRVDADLRLMPGYGTAAGVGYTHTLEDRTHRIFESTSEHLVRFTFDLPRHDRFTVRSRFEHSERRGEGDDAAIAAELTAVGEQPGMRHFDIASRNRNRVTVLGSLAANESLSFTLSAARGKDDYLESLFGLRDNSHRVLSVGFDLAPLEQNFTVSGSYDYERYEAVSRSRQANPGVQFTEASRNWAADGTDRVHSVVLNAALTKIADKLDVTFGYDYNRAHALYTYITGAVADRTLPEEVIVPTILPTPSQLPLVRSELQRGTVDAVYAVTNRIGVGVSYWYESYAVSDFTLDADANPDLARGQALLIGYLYRPYTAQTVWGRLIYRW